jgi:hypothetical protein
MEKDLDNAALKIALTRLSKHISNTFPNVLPLVCYTIGGATLVSVIGNRPSTHDVDVSIVLLEARYGHKYPNIHSDFEHLVMQVYNELYYEGLDIGEMWCNWTVDLVLPDGAIRFSSKI